MSKSFYSPRTFSAGTWVLLHAQAYLVNARHENGGEWRDIGDCLAFNLTSTLLPRSLTIENRRAAHMEYLDEKIKQAERSLTSLRAIRLRAWTGYLKEDQTNEDLARAASAGD
jgi:hypothetical protein